MSARGFAVPLALLLLLALTGLAHGALLMARSEEGASRLAATLLARELAVRGTLLAVARSGDTLPLVAVGSRALLAAPEGTAPSAVPLRLHLERLAPELHLLSGEVVGFEASSAGLLVWTLDPAWRAAMSDGGGTIVGGEAAYGGVGGSGPAARDGCEALEAVQTPGAPTGVLAATEPPGLGLLVADSLLARAAIHVSGVVSPGPGADPWTCPSSDPLNWGAPSDPGHPCAGRRPFAAADGDLVVDGGEGQGVLAVAGDLVLRGALYHGLVLVGGGVTLEAGARVHGRIISAGRVAADPASAVEADPCAVYLALADAGALRAPLLLPEGPWLRPL
ncbi:MAG: hypothetical protein KY453_01620 [Gemmatimonadetes bacterium]|nr:hypothetical protein [Gemmatimonadota bacterium]